MKFDIGSISIWMLAGLLIGAGIFAAGCLQAQDLAAPGAEHSTPTPTPTPAVVSAIARPPSLYVDAHPVRPSYLPGEEAEVLMTFRNEGADSITLRSFPPEICLTNPTWGAVRHYPCGSGTMALEPGESADHILHWDQRDDDGDQVPPGYYSVEAVGIPVEAAGVDGTLYSEGVAVAQVLVRYPQGAMEGHVYINQSRTVNGFAVEFEDITCSSTGARARILVRSSGMPPTMHEGRSDLPTPPPTPPDLNPSAHYRIDDGPKKEFMRVGFEVVDGGTVLVWDFEPIPADAGDLHVVITGLGMWEGVCKFQGDLSGGILPG
ncbi:MAG: hypothetical protein KO206_03590 [Methanomicrobiaceae archaeon]|uniref:Intracellular proteinase inhibitor BsuPI domain-containing protein n=1 Tax=hydrocarbon metagenome TaxID=938273 RepID=A0A0W8FGH9_9ZZZZ|nr:hypothetical protein [Methanomicrobiaceae archaeon]MDD5419280.1 hypothetical protein [Methanomicrobiaceae archaeon]